MADPIYLIDPTTQRPVRVEPVAFHEINVKERADLERWVLSHPDILGEKVLVLTAEYDRFDKSNRRLDVLALDEAGTLVVVELKLDLAGSWADQQGVRYAAFCSNMAMEDCVEILARHENCSNDNASEKIRTFLQVDELPQLTNQPRIILAAGSLDDQELTSCVLWLRRFGVDITCIELTPYRLPTSQQVILVPRIIIPLPETRNYQIAVEKKEVARIQKSKDDTLQRQLFVSIATEFNGLNTISNGKAIKTTPTAAKDQSYKTISIGVPRIHYEWAWRKRDSKMDVCLHFESSDREENLAWLEQVKLHENDIREGIALEFDAGPWGRIWAQLRFRIPFDGNPANPQIAKEAATLMRTLIERTYPLIQNLQTANSLYVQH